MNPEDNTPQLSPPDPARNGLNDQDELTDVTSMHASIMHEKAEPQEGHEPISLWLVTFIGALLFWGRLYLQRYSGNFQPLVYNEKAFLSAAILGSNTPAHAPVDPLQLGRRIYIQICQACHQENGQGLPAQYPPLSQSDWVQARSTARVIRIVLNGLNGPIQVNDQSFDNLMPAWRDTLSDTEIAAVLTYVRQEWGNRATAVKPEEVTALREATRTRGSPGLWTAWTATELKAIPETE
jgi:mono/diheme cytochrome c family protein